MVVISQHNTGQLLTFNVSSSEFSDVITYDYKHDCQPEVSIGSNNDVYRLLPLLRRLHFWFVSLSEKLPAQGNFHINCLKEEPFTFWIRIARRIHTFIFTYVNDLGGGLSLWVSFLVHYYYVILRMRTLAVLIYRDIELHCLLHYTAAVWWVFYLAFS